eukprot:CAMPEP_0196663128 /NCGR_PEP_ID=MMETSP1086-20130531/51579_1 /TAXON_ID=77921 /ORGANISM="Cyanoptyche  gloeocystis , Strain SAG4.97" /LENGTH=38 /DNA_ID= /DNA_START= /DNA_END= /DNA_ORIENTATION=
MAGPDRPGRKAGRRPSSSLGRPSAPPSPGPCPCLCPST